MAVDNQSALNYSMLAVALLVWYLLYLFFGYIFQMGAVGGILAPYIDPGGKIVPFILGLAGAGAAFAMVRRNENVNKFGQEVIVELKKVIWPTRKEVTGSTTAVVIVIFIVAVFLFIFDKIFGRLIAILVR